MSQEQQKDQFQDDLDKQFHWEPKTLTEHIQATYWKCVPYNWRPGEIIYRLKCFFFHRYTVIHPRTMPHYTWTDRCDLLPHCMFSILCDFVEREEPFKNNHLLKEDRDNEKDPQLKEFLILQLDTDTKLENLYNWWTKEYVPYFNQSCEKFDYDKDEQMELILKQKCHELVDLMGAMWT